MSKKHKNLVISVSTSKRVYVKVVFVFSCSVTVTKAKLLKGQMWLSLKHHQKFYSGPIITLKKIRWGHKSNYSRHKTWSNQEKHGQPNKETGTNSLEQYSYLGKTCGKSTAGKSSGEGDIGFAFGIGHHFCCGLAGWSKR